MGVVAGGVLVGDGTVMRDWTVSGARGRHRRPPGWGVQALRGAPGIGLGCAKEGLCFPAGLLLVRCKGFNETARCRSLAEAPSRIQASDPERPETPRVRTGHPGVRGGSDWLPGPSPVGVHAAKCQRSYEERYFTGCCGRASPIGAVFWPAPGGWEVVVEYQR